VRTKILSLTLLVILGSAAISEAFSTVLVTDEGGMRALANSDRRASIRGKVASISTKYYAVHRYDVYLHFEGVKDDRVIAFIAPDAFEDSYGVNLGGLVGKTVEITSRARVESNGQIFFSAIDWSQFKVLDSGPGSPKIAEESRDQPEFTPKATADQRRVIQALSAQAEADSLPALEKLGLGYFSGTLGLKQDYRKSAEYFNKALTHSGHCDRAGPCPSTSLIARIWMAKQYEYGLGVDKDTQHAEQLYIQSMGISGNPQLNKELWKEQQALEKINPDPDRDPERRKILEAVKRQEKEKEKGASPPDPQVVKAVAYFISNMMIPVETDCYGSWRQRTCVNWVRPPTPEEQAAMRGPAGQMFVGALIEQLTQPHR